VAPRDADLGRPSQGPITHHSPGVSRQQQAAAAFKHLSIEAPGIRPEPGGIRGSGALLRGRSASGTDRSKLSFRKCGYHGAHDVGKLTSGRVDQETRAVSTVIHRANRYFDCGP